MNTFLNEMNILFHLCNTLANPDVLVFLMNFNADKQQ